MKFSIYLTFVFLFFISSIPVFSQDVSWEKLGGLPGGGRADQLHEDSQGRLFWLRNEYFGGEDSEIFRSLDSGLNWEKVQFPNVPNVVFDYSVFGEDKAIYLHGQGNSWKTFLYRSTDGGGTFQLLNDEVDMFENIDLVLPSGTMLSSGFGQTMRSTDWGTTWQPILTNANSQDNGYSFYYDAASQKTFTIGNKYGNQPNEDTLRIFCSTDDGLNWDLIFEKFDFAATAGWVTRTPNGTIFAAIAENLLIRSTDGGITWDEMDLTGLNNSNWYYASQISTLPGGDLVCAIGGFPFRSADNGSTWQPMKHILFINDYRNGIKATSNGNLFFSGSSFYRSTDNGQTWKFASTGISHGAPTDMAFKNDQEFYATTLDGAFETSDGGSNWTLLEDKPAQKFLFGIELNAVGDVFYSNLGNLFRRLNGAAAAETLPIVLSNYNYYSEQMAINSDGQIFVNSYDTTLNWHSLARSSDNGNTWQPLNMPFSFYEMVQLKFAPGGKMLLKSLSEMFRSEDNGVTWEYFDINNFYSGFIENAPSDQIWVFGSNPQGEEVIFKSIDLFATWDSTLIDPLSGIYFSGGDFAPVINQAGHVFSESFGGNISRSVDGGLTFNDLPVIEKYGLYSMQGLFLGTDQKLYVSDQIEGLFRTKDPTTDFTLLTGKVFHDVDENCLAAAPDSILQAIKVKIRKNTTGNTVFGTSDATGKYLAPVSLGGFQIEAVPPSKYWSGCVSTTQVLAADLGTTVDSANVVLKPLQHCPLLSVDLQAGFLRRCFDGSYFVFYKNSGTEPAAGAFVEVTLDPFLVFKNASIPLTSQNGNVLKFDLGQVGINKKGSFRIDFEVSCTAPLGQVHCSEAHIFPNQHCPAWLGGELRAFSDCGGAGGTHRLFLKNIGQNDMLSPADWSLAETDFTTFYDTLVSFQSGKIQLAAGQTFEKTMPNNGHAFTIWANQEQNFPLIYAQTGSQIKDCGQPGGATDWFWENAPFASSSCQSNNGSWDPNDKSAQPAGIGAEHRIEKNTTLEYLVRFQNTGTDTAFNIVVRDTISQLLDPASIEPGVSSHAYRFELLGTGEVVFTFNNIQLPDSNINFAASNGFVKFRISQRENLADDLVIRNRAAIFFDFNEPVFTNTVERTIGLPKNPTIGTSEKDLSKNVLEVRPNPASAEFEIFFSSKNDFKKIFILTDALGKIVRQVNFSGENLKIERGDLPSGVFFVSIKNERGELLAARKIILQ